MSLSISFLPKMGLKYFICDVFGHVYCLICIECIPCIFFLDEQKRVACNVFITNNATNRAKARNNYFGSQLKAFNLQKLRLCFYFLIVSTHAVR